MRKYIYPGNLRAAVQLWFWSIKDFVILVLLALLSVSAKIKVHRRAPKSA